MASDTVGELQNYSVFPVEIVPDRGEGERHWEARHGAHGKYIVTFAAVPPIGDAVLTDIRRVDSVVQNEEGSLLSETDVKRGSGGFSPNSVGQADRPVTHPVTGERMAASLFVISLEMRKPGNRDHGTEANRQAFIKEWQDIMAARLNKKAWGLSGIYQDAANRFIDPEAAARHNELLGRTVVPLQEPPATTE